MEQQEVINHVLDRVHSKAGQVCALLLDYDGTLVPFAPLPELAAPDAELLQLLAELAARPDTVVHIVSGRTHTSLDAWLGHLPLWLHAEHGLWGRPSAELGWKMRFELDGETDRWMGAVARLMAAASAETAGAFVEQKSGSLAWHYRNSEPAVAQAARQRLRASLEPVCEAHGLAFLDGINVLEIRGRGVHKGHVVRDVASDERHPFILAVGDDVTDEDMFAALPPAGLAVAAGPGALSPSLRLGGPAGVRALLRALSESPSYACGPPAALGKVEQPLA